MDLARIKDNVAKMAAQNAPEADIDGYIASEGVSIDDVRNFQAEQPKNFAARMGDDLERRQLQANALSDRALNREQSTPENLAQMAGIGLGLMGDATGNAIGSAYRYLPDVGTTEFVKSGLKGIGEGINAVAPNAKTGLNYLMGEGARLAEENPRAAANLGAAGNILSVAPIGAASKTAVNIAGDASNLAGKKMAGALEKMATPKQVAPTSEQFADLGREAYKRAYDSGERFAPDAVSDKFVASINAAKPKKIAGVVDTELSKELEAGLKKYEDLLQKELSIDEVDIIDKDLSNLKDQAYSSGKNQLGGQLADIQNALRGSVAEAPSGQALKEGRDFFRKKYQLEDIERIFRNAEGRPNEAAIIQTGFRNLARQSRKKGSGYSKEQIALMDKAAKGGLSIDALKLASSRLIPMVAGASGGVAPAAAAYVGNLAAAAGATALQTAKANKLAKSITKGIAVDAPPSRINKLAKALTQKKPDGMSAQERLELERKLKAEKMADALNKGSN
jgi:hypothetical protein